MAKKTHLGPHKYKFLIMGKEYRVYACAFPNCYHYIPENAAVGKESICWRCGKPCEIRRENNGEIRKKPHHQACNVSRPKVKVIEQPRAKLALDAVDKLLDKLLADSKTGTE